MLELLKDWKGEVDIDDKHYSNIRDATSDFKRVSDTVHIRLYAKTAKRIQRNLTQERSTVNSDNQQYKITVKKYMTQQSSPEFDFMAKWNNNNPMPLRTMIGTVEKETPGMVYMKLHGQAEPVITCMRCGRQLTNPISQMYGIGPECMEKLGFVRVAIDDVETIKKKLVDVVWEGWIIKSAITEKEMM